jgi:peroxiredoxin
MRISFVAALLFISLLSHAQSGYKIDFKIKGLKDTTAYLCYYFSDQTLLRDTAKVNSAGAFSFDGPKDLLQGTYFLAVDNKKEKVKLPFEMVVGADQRFTLETSTEDYVMNMKVTGDEDNKLFFENMFFNSARHKEAEPFIKILKDSTLKEDQKKEAREGFKKINDKVIAYQKDVIAKYPNTVTGKIFKSTQDIVIPDPPKKADGTIDSTFQFYYYRNHYFDNFDLSDEVNLRMPRPFYRDKVYDYLDRLFIQHPDTLTKAIEKLAAKAQKNQETYKYITWISQVHYQTPKIMGLDEVYVNVVDKYFKTGAMDFWLDPATKNSMVEYADKVRRGMIGRTASNLIMQDQNMQPRALYDIKKKYTILYIFDPDCGHCREESPKLVDFYNKNKDRFGIEVFAVSADSSMKKLKDYIKEMKMPWITVNGLRTYQKQHYSDLYYAETTPSLYIIDDKKKVIARKLSVESLPDFFEKHEKYTKRNPNG